MRSHREASRAGALARERRAGSRAEAHTGVGGFLSRPERVVTGHDGREWEIYLSRFESPRSEATPARVPVAARPPASALGLCPRAALAGGTVRSPCSPWALRAGDATRSGSISTRSPSTRGRSRKLAHDHRPSRRGDRGGRAAASGSASSPAPDARPFPRQPPARRRQLPRPRPRGLAEAAAAGPGARGGDRVGVMLELVGERRELDRLAAWWASASASSRSANQGLRGSSGPCR